jgi:hypothetical protein
MLKVGTLVRTDAKELERNGRGRPSIRMPRKLRRLFYAIKLHGGWELLFLREDIVVLQEPR